MIDPADPFLLFDDGPAGRARLYTRPVAIIRAARIDEVGPALDAVRAGVRAGRHAAGYLAYEAGQAFEPRLAAAARLPASGPLCWFALFDGVELLSGDGLADRLGDPRTAHAAAPRPRISRNDYLTAAGHVREGLFAGDFYQANLTFGCDVALAGPPLALYAAIRPRAAAGWGGVLRHEDGWLLSFSPEQFFRIKGRRIEARPMKGTSPRGRSEAEDRALAAALAADPKQRAENLMIVDLLRNDLARIAEPGSVTVPGLFEVEAYPTVLQMVSRVEARLAAGVDAVDVLATIFPCGSITGAPKIAAIEALRQLEPEARGAYTGSMGWIDPSGDAAFNVLIRTLEIVGDSTVAKLGLGSGLVVDSNAPDEWDECRLKGAFVTKGQTPFDLIETMRFEPADGIVDLERHLERMKASATALGFRFDRHAARNELQAATFGRKEAAMVRLLLGQSGAMAIQLRAVDQPAEPVVCAIRPMPVEPGDFRLAHKTTDRHFYDDARQEEGRFEVLFEDREGRLTEGSRTTIYVERDGVLFTPPLELGLMRSVLRQRLIDEGRAVERVLTRGDLDDGFFIGNSARGLLAATLA